MDGGPLRVTQAMASEQGSLRVTQAMASEHGEWTAAASDGGPRSGAVRPGDPAVSDSGHSKLHGCQGAISAVIHSVHPAENWQIWISFFAHF